MTRCTRSRCPTRRGSSRSPRHGRARRFADLPSGGFLNGLAFDRVGEFGRGLLVSARVDRATTLYAIDCRGTVRVIAAGLPQVEGGMAVAPRGFGRFAGRLIAPDELTGRIYAIDDTGRTRVLAGSG